MVSAFSRLKRILRERYMTVPELYRRMLQEGMSINLKSLYRLSNEQQPLQRLDLRVAGAICQVFALPLSDLIVFETTGKKLRRFAAKKQKRLEALMAQNNAGTLTKPQEQELRELVREAEEIMLDNARQLAEQRQPLATP
jgi:Cro/C1-type HTH DNA-binding domain